MCEFFPQLIYHKITVKARVLSKYFISSNLSSLSFLFADKKPIKQNSFVDNPETIKAFIKAQAPGIGIISILFSIAFLIISSPGSEIPGLCPGQQLVAG